MSKCNIDHSHQDVMEKFQSQQEFMPSSLVQQINTYLSQNISQENLNELFHLLKKYDLATEEEKEQRNDKINELIG